MALCAVAVSASAQLNPKSASGSVALSVINGAKPWPGEQEITVRAANERSSEFSGNLSAQIGKTTHSVPVVLAAKSARNFNVPVILNSVGLHQCKIVLRDAQGDEVAEIKPEFKTWPPLVLLPVCPCYIAQGAGSEKILIDAMVNLPPERRPDMRVTLTMQAPELKQTQIMIQTPSPGETTEFRTTISNTDIGVFKIDGKLTDAQDREIGAAQGSVHVIEASAARVTIGPDGFLRVAGKPEFPIGLYSSSRDEELARAGFNATHNYNISSGNADAAINRTDFQLQQLLDESWSNGLRMMVELPRKAIEEGRWTQVRRRIETFRHHPGLLCWGSEERVARGLAKPANMAELYTLVHQLDPDHPLVLGDTRDVIKNLQVDRRDFFPDNSMDAGIWWWYPIPLKTAATNTLQGQESGGNIMEPPGWLTTTHSKKPLWIAIQAYQKPQREARFPTPAEYRCQAYLSIINGVKGLFFYTGSGQKDYWGEPSGILNKPEEGHWDYVKKLAGELRDFSPVIMAPAAAGKLQLTPAGAPVEFATRTWEGKTYLIAANKSNQPQKVEWLGEFLRNKNVTTLFEDHQARINGDGMSDKFAAFAVHVYRFD